jgi:hypothetical protein
MSYKEDIDKAIIAHGQWKQRLMTAVTTGKSEFSVEKVRVDNLCDFGKWFFSLPAALKETDHGKKVHDLHARFHQEAARILEKALSGKAEEAQRDLSSGSLYTQISGQLTISLNRWKETIEN